jgi:hypothetical protein
MSLLGIYGTMLLFAVNCLVSGVIIIALLPETKGKSFEEILQLLEK